jgi:F420-non-reducing hydrogenase large subunit
MRRISIDPITRLEGHGRIEIFLDEQGDVDNVFLQVPELRGFERFCVGRAVEDMPNLTARICGVCPEAHHLAATKALDALFSVEPPPTAKKLRELLYSIFFATDHTTHFYALGGPDFIVGPQAPKEKRNLLGVIEAVGQQMAAKVLKMRRDGHQLLEMIGGRAVHLNWGLPGGVSRGIDESKRREIEKRGREAVEFAKDSLRLFERLVLGNSRYVELIQQEGFTLKTYSMGTVDANDQVNFYEGMIRVVDPTGDELVRYHPASYRDQIAERVEPWSYVSLSQAGRLERFCRWRAVGCLPRNTTITPQRRLGYGYTPGSGRVQPNVRDSRGQARAPYARHALGAPDRAALRDRALGRAGDRSGDYRLRCSGAAHARAARRRGLRGGAARHADAPLHD